MLSSADIVRLNHWKRQLNASIAVQEKRLKALERRIVRAGTFTKQTAQALAVLEKAIIVCKNTVRHLEATSGFIKMIIDSKDGRVGATTTSAGSTRTLPGAKPRQVGEQLPPR